MEKQDATHVVKLKQKYLRESDFHTVKHDRCEAYNTPCGNPACPKRK